MAKGGGTGATGKAISRELLQKALKIGDSLKLSSAIMLDQEGLKVTYFLFAGDLGQYVELCRRLSGCDISEEFVDKPLSGKTEIPIGMIHARIG